MSGSRYQSSVFRIYSCPYDITMPKRARTENPIPPRIWKLLLLVLTFLRKHCVTLRWMSIYTQRGIFPSLLTLNSHTPSLEFAHSGEVIPVMQVRHLQQTAALAQVPTEHRNRTCETHCDLEFATQLPQFGIGRLLLNSTSKTHSSINRIGRVNCLLSSQRPGPHSGCRLDVGLPWRVTSLDPTRSHGPNEVLRIF